MMVANITEPIIDAWANPPRKPGQASPLTARLAQLSGTANIREKGYSLEQMVSDTDEAGIQTAMLSAWYRPGQKVNENDEVAEIIRQVPGRFYGVAAVNLEKPVEAVHELERAVKELGFKALRVVPWLWNRPPNDKFYFPLYVKCIDLNIPFCTQVGHTGPLMPSETGRPIPYLDEVALTFPELHIVGGHIGYPWTDEMISLAWKHENVFIDTSAYLPRYYPSQLIHYLNTYGKKKVLFGTNSPQLPFGRCAEQARALVLREVPRANFLYNNARRVFNID